MIIVVAGGGDIGLTLLRRLMESYPRARLILIDSSRETCEKVASRYTNVHVVYGNAADVHVLERAGVRHADYYIAVTGDDTVNIISALLALREGARSVIVRVNRPGYEELARMLGIENVVAPARSTAFQIDLMIKGPGFVDLNKLVAGDVLVEEELVTSDSPLNGYELPLCCLPGKRGHVLFVIREGKILLPGRNVKLRPGDRVVVARSPGG